MYAARDPLSVGMVLAGGAYRRVRGLRPAGLIFRLIGGPAYAVWRLVYCGGLLAWGITLAWLVYGWRRAKRLCTTTYRVRTAKPLPGGRLRVVQISDLHAGSTMDAARADELAGRVAALDPDLLVFTGDIYDETTPRAAFDAYNRAFARMPRPLRQVLYLWQPRSGRVFCQLQLYPYRPGDRPGRGGHPRAGGTWRCRCTPAAACCASSAARTGCTASTGAFLPAS